MVFLIKIYNKKRWILHVSFIKLLIFWVLSCNDLYTRSLIHFFLCLSSIAPVCMVCYCQRKITSADLLVQMVQPRILKRYIFKIFYRELFRVYLENISSAGNKNIRARWYQTSKYCISAFCSFSFHSGTVEVPLQWIFVIFLDHLGLIKVFFTDGYIWSSYFLTNGFIYDFVIYGKYKLLSVVLTRCTCTPCTLHGGR